MIANLHCWLIILTSHSAPDQLTMQNIVILEEDCFDENKFSKTVLLTSFRSRF